LNSDRCYSMNNMAINTIAIWLQAFSFPGLVFAHSALVLSFLEISLNPVLLGLHV
jgi:hypothetical protein